MILCHPCDKQSTMGYSFNHSQLTVSTTLPSIKSAGIISDILTTDELQKMSNDGHFPQKIKGKKT